jgi:hypothetical protein
MIRLKALPQNKNSAAADSRAEPAIALAAFLKRPQSEAFKSALEHI